MSSQQAYRGYLVTANHIDGMFYISKDAHFIATAKSLEEAKKSIDLLVPDLVIDYMSSDEKAYANKHGTGCRRSWSGD